MGGIKLTAFLRHCQFFLGLTWVLNLVHISDSWSNSCHYLSSPIILFHVKWIFSLANGSNRKFWEKKKPLVLFAFPFKRGFFDRLLISLTDEISTLLSLICLLGLDAASSSFPTGQDNFHEVKTNWKTWCKIRSLCYFVEFLFLIKSAIVNDGCSMHVYSKHCCFLCLCVDAF